MQRFGLFAAALLSAAACNNEITGLEPPSNPATETFAPALGVDIPSMSQTSSGVYYRDVTVGTGLSWNSPFGPLVVDFGYAIIKEDFDETELFSFSFGTQF